MNDLICSLDFILWLYLLHDLGVNSLCVDLLLMQFL